MTVFGNQNKSVGNIKTALEELEIRYYQTLNDLRLTREENIQNAVRYIELMDELNSKNSELDRKNRELEFLTSDLEKTVAVKVDELIKTNQTLEEEIVRRSKIEMQLESTAIQADSANRAKSEFIANMSHEIRTPMNGVIGMASLLKDAGLSEEHNEYAEAIISSAEALLVIIDDILDLSKIESGMMTIEAIPFDLLKSVNDSLNSVKATGIDKNIDIQLDFNSDVPKYVHGDPVRLWQVLTNLLGNAVKFTDKGRVVLTVAPKEHLNGNIELVFSVEDTGIGINSDKLDEIFNMFSQEDTSTTRKYGGSGLGLAISKHLIELMGGEITVESHKGRGTKFTFHLPLQVCSESEIIQESMGDKDYYAHIAKRSFKILVAEDNPINQKLAVKIFSKMGFVVDSVSNGLDVFDAYCENSYDMIFMDIQMPGMDGLAVTEKIREDERNTGKHIPIIAMTANAMKGDKEKCLAAGMDDYLPKPLRKKTLDYVIMKFV